MTESPQIQKDAEVFQSKFDDEALDYKQYDDFDDESTCGETYDNVDEDKLELTETVEKELEMVNGTYLPGDQLQCSAYGAQNYFNNPSGQYFQYRNYLPTQNMGFPNYAQCQWNNMNEQANTQNITLNKDGKYYAHNNIMMHPSNPYANNVPVFPSMNNMNYNKKNLHGMNIGPSDAPNGGGYRNNVIHEQYEGWEAPENPDKGMHRKNPEHIKKPLNAFMLYMKAVRPEVLKEIPYKDSTTINQMIGKMWQSLTREQQAHYFELARQEREKHRIMYPDYNPRDYYATSHKKKKKKRQKEGDKALVKKCRARYGIAQQDKWCKHCKRKKRCLRTFNDSNSAEEDTKYSDDKLQIDSSVKPETIF